MTPTTILLMKSLTLSKSIAPFLDLWDRGRITTGTFYSSNDDLSIKPRHAVGVDFFYVNKIFMQGNF